MFGCPSIGVSGALKSPAIVLLLISPFILVSICLTYWGAPMLGAYITVISSFDPCYIFLWSFDHYVLSLFLFMVFISKSILSDMSIATLAFFWSPFPWNIFFQPFPFSLYVSLGLRCVSCRHIYRGLVFVFIQPVLVFWLGHLTHLYLR